MVQIAVSGKSGPQLTPGVEHHLADRAAVRAEPDDQRVQRGAVDDVATKISLPRDQLGVHGAAQRGKQVPPLGLPGGLETEPARQPVPVLGVQRTSGRRQKCGPILADTSRMTNL
jgi:hypothetical protein